MMFYTAILAGIILGNLISVVIEFHRDRDIDKKATDAFNHMADNEYRHIVSDYDPFDVDSDHDSMEVRP